MSQDINNIDTYETRTKVNTKNGGQSMRLYMKIISKSLIFSLRVLSENVKKTNVELDIPHKVKKKHKANGNGTKFICTSLQAPLKGFEICCN